MLSELECIKRVESEASALKCPSSQMQQDPREFGSLIHFLLNQPTTFKHYLEIGAGCGHTARVLDSFFDFETVRLIDNEEHYRDRLDQIPKAQEWAGDSMSPDAGVAVVAWDVPYDLVLVDGGHSYECVKSDTYLALLTCGSPCFFVFHDARHGQVRRWLSDLHAGVIPGMTHVRQFGRDEPRGHIVNTSLWRWDKPCSD